MTSCSVSGGADNTTLAAGVWVRVSRAEVIQEVADINVAWGVNLSEMAEETCVLWDVRVT